MSEVPRFRNSGLSQFLGRIADSEGSFWTTASGRATCIVGFVLTWWREWGLKTAARAERAFADQLALDPLSPSQGMRTCAWSPPIGGTSRRWSQRTWGPVRHGYTHVHFYVCTHMWHVSKSRRKTLRKSSRGRTRKGTRKTDKTVHVSPPCGLGI